MLTYDIKDINLAETGFKRIKWAQSQMEVLDSIKKRFEIEKPLKNNNNCMSPCNK